MAHIIGGCKTSLNQGRYTFRHDSVLKEVLRVLRSLASSIKTPSKRGAHHVEFVKAGARSKITNKWQNNKKKSENPSGIIHLAFSWKVTADLDNDFVFPANVALTQDRPDIVLVAESLRRVVLVELTVPCEENFEHHKKQEKYIPIEAQARTNGWGVDIFAVEVGARGF